MSDVTRVLSAIEQGDPHAAEQLLPLVYDELRKLAAARLAQEKPGQTLQATALVHEAYLRLVDVEQAQRFNSRSHFFAACGAAMRAAAEQAKSIFLHAVEIAAGAERGAYLDAACGADAGLRREVEELLGHHGGLGSFLEGPALDATGRYEPGRVLEAGQGRGI